MQTCSVGCTLAKDEKIYLCACVEVWRISWYICALFDAFSNKWNSALCLLYLLRLSHDLQTFLNVLMYTDLFSGMNTSQGSGDILVRMCGSWENFVCLKMRRKVRRCTTKFRQIPHMRTTISPDLWIVYIPMNRWTSILTLKESKKAC